MRSADRSCIAGVTWAKVSAVVEMFEWPRLRDTIARSSPASSISVAKHCLRSWKQHFQLYPGQGRERQKLVDPFPAMMIDGTFSFAAGLAHQEAMLKALAGYKREVLDDGIVGNELAIALFLAVGRSPTSPPASGSGNPAPIAETGNVASAEGWPCSLALVHDFQHVVEPGQREHGEDHDE